LRPILRPPLLHDDVLTVPIVQIAHLRDVYR
jgi:hypothetical protein